MVDSWNEWGLLAIAAKGQSDVEFNGAIPTDSLEIDSGDKDFDIIALLNGGRLEKPTPEGETTITFDAYFTDLDAASNSGILQLFHTTSSNWDASQPLEVSNSRNRDQFRVAILWTEDTTVSSATAQVPAGSEALRCIIADARLISAKMSFGDGILKTTVKFKVAPFKKDGTSNITWQSTDGTATLDALASYS